MHQRYPVVPVQLSAPFTTFLSSYLSFFDSFNAGHLCIARSSNFDADFPLTLVLPLLQALLALTFS